MAMMNKADIKKRLKDNTPAFIIWLCVAAALAAADQLTKYFASTLLQGNPKKGFIPYIFNLVYVENKGAAWGMFADARWVFIVVSTVAIIAVIAVLLFFSREHILFCLSLSMILAGGVGNMIDRVANGFVVDFLQFAFWEDFPVFNGADSFVTVGAVLLIVYVVFFDKKLFRDDKNSPKIAVEGATEDGSKETDTDERRDK